MHLRDEIHFPTVFGLEIEDIRYDPPECSKHQVFEEMAGIYKDAGADRSYQRMVDAIDLFGIGVGPCQGCVKYAHREQEVSVLKPLQVVDLGALCPNDFR